jgi:hypothetical protein
MPSNGQLKLESSNLFLKIFLFHLSLKSFLRLFEVSVFERKRRRRADNVKRDERDEIKQ